MTVDAIALGIGVRRSVSFLEGSGIELGERGVKTNERFETNVAGIWAAGDVAEYFDPVSGDFRITGNWTHAVLEGTRAGLNMAGDSTPFISVPAYSISCLGMHLALVGAGSDEAITRADREGGRYGHFFFQDGMLTGAFLINRPKDKPYFTDLIARRAHLETFERDSIWKM
ncbi:MAG: FAD-dependent oxidoreductase [Candidatus Sungbacteria bacterium]|nr:FAD-dependent oxidoreductase [Candidatus Sungbacteria bacterium]